LAPDKPISDSVFLTFEQVKPTSTFQELALDSLDTVELIVAIEEVGRDNTTPGMG
jgi:acyl carrier protein